MTTALHNRSWEIRKKVIAIAIALCVLCIGIFFCLPQASATDDDGDDDTITGEQIYDLLDSVFGIATYTDTSSNPYLVAAGVTSVEASHTRLYDLVNNDRNASDNPGIGTLLSSACSVIKDLAYFFLVLIIAVKAIQEASRGDPTLETWLRMFMVAIVGIIFIEYCDEIFEYLSALGERFISLMRDAITSAESEGFTEDGISGIKGWKKIVVRLLIWASKFAIVIPAWSLFYELAIRHIFAPIAVVDIAAEGMHSNGVRYMKNYFGIFLRVVIAYVCGYVMSILLATLSVSEMNWFPRLLSTIGIVFGGAGMLGKSQSLVKEILGS